MNSVVLPFVGIVLLILNLGPCLADLQRPTDNAVQVRAAEQKTARGCEGRLAQLSCPFKSVIRVVLARFGRFGNSRCDNDYSDPDCITYFTQKIHHMCKNQNYCGIKVENVPYQDPCPWKKKQLEVTFTCKKTGGDVYTAYACENNYFKATCPSGHLIEILEANYGRKKNSRLCNPMYIGRGTNEQECVNDVRLKMRTMCYKNYCEGYATNDRFGDTCWGVWKTLEVKYKCHDVNSRPTDNAVQARAAEQKTARGCKGKLAELSCPFNTVINIVDAKWGRFGHSRCDNDFSDRNCIENVRYRIYNMCHGQNYCGIKVEDIRYRDPCPWKNKQLEVTFTCQETGGNVYTAYACENNYFKATCPSGHLLEILEANYGRKKNSHLCRPMSLGRGTNEEECVNDVWLKMRTLCDRNYCEGYATNDRFGDTCWGVWKTLEVKYKCHDVNSRML